MSGKGPARAPTPTGSTVGSSPPKPTPTIEEEEGSEDEEMPDATPPQQVNVTSELQETLRVKLPDTFSGNRKELEVFLLQVSLYQHFNNDKFPQPSSYALWTASYLRGEALRWVEPFLKDLFKNSAEPDKMMATTRAIFSSKEGFAKEIRRMFGDIDEAKTAENHLYGLRQTGSVINYATEFQRHANQTGWDTVALTSHYKRGLKTNIRIELARMEQQPTHLVNLIEHTVKIDNRMYEFQREQHGQHRFQPKNKGYQKNEGRKRNFQPKDNRWSDPMELDAMTKKKPSLSKEQMDQRRRDKLCFECGLPGHMANSHRKKPGNWKKGNKQVNTTGRGGYNEPTRQIAVISRAMREDMLEDLQIHTQNDHCDGYDELELAAADYLRSQQEITEGINELEIAAIDFIDNQRGRTPIPQIRVERSSSTEDSSETDSSMEDDEEDHSGDWDIDNPIPDPEENLPQVGEIWKVVQREELHGEGTREWQNVETGESYVEPPSRPGGPQWGERYEVTYRDPERIGWLGTDNAEGKSYLHNMDYEDTATFHEPEVGQKWQLVAESRTRRMWWNIDEAGNFYRETIRPGSSTTFETGEIYRVVYENDGHRGWSNVVNGHSHLELCTIGPDGQIHCKVQLWGQTFDAMIDSGASGNFINPKTVIKHTIWTRVKGKPYRLTVANGSDIGKEGIEIETIELEMTTQGRHFEMISFDVAPIGNHDIILGMPWMQQHNPSIDWADETIEFDRCRCPEIVPRDEGEERIQDQGQVCATAQEKLESGAQDSPAIHELLVSNKVVSNKDNTPQDKLAERYQRKFPELFSNEQGIKALPKHQPWDHEIPLEEGAEIPFLPIIPLSADKLRTLREYLDTNLAKGFIRESTSQARAPLFFVEKKDDPVGRPVGDYRKLNDKTIKDRLALPLAGELRDRLQGAKIFTKLDLRGAYNLIRMKEGEEWKTAFGTRYGHYEYTVMPFGLCNAPATCQRLMNNILRKWLDQQCICYLDDILIYGLRIEEHEATVTNIMQALQDAGLKLKMEKCCFNATEVTFLGYVITTQGIQMDPAKVESVLAWSAPTNVKGVQSFLGFANFYRRFIKDYSKIAAPLTTLTRKDIVFEWNDAAQAAFEELKLAFSKAPVLASFDPEKKIQLETDSSDYAIGAVLSQPNEQGR